MHGSGASCNTQIPVPARIDVTPGSAKAYTPCNPINSDSVTAAYIHKNPRYIWTATNSSDMLTHTDAVILKGATYRFLVGRVKTPTWTSICKVHSDNGAFGCWYYNPATGQEISVTTGFEILKCPSKLTTLYI